MNWVIFIAGATLVIAVLVDLIWTSLWVGGGAGTITRGVARTSWLGFHRLSGKGGRALTMAGPMILALTVAAWIFILWTGWFLVFTAGLASVISSSTHEVADTSDRLYFVGYTIFTLGNGDYKPNGDGWQLATALAAGSGLLAITLAITYLLSVVSAAVSGRSFAAQVSGMGDSAAGAVTGGWNGTSYAALAYPLQSLSSEASKLAEQYLAYPVLQYFHSEDPSKSPILALASLEQVVAVAQYGVPDGCRPPPVLLASATSAISNVLEALPHRLVKPAEDPLPNPSLEALSLAELPHLTPEEFGKGLQLDVERRKRLRGLVEAHGWAVEDLKLS